MAPDETTSTSVDDPPSSPTRPPARGRPSGRHLALSVAIALVVAALTAVALSVVLRDDDPVEPSATANLAEAQPAPTTAFQKLDGSGEASLADYAGTPVVLNFFAESCVPCRKEMPDLQRVHDEVGDRVTVLGIDQGDTREVATAFVQELGVTYPIGHDPSGDVARAFGVDYLPGTVFITRTGDIVGLHRGQLSYDDLRRLVDEHLR